MPAPLVLSNQQRTHGQNGGGTRDAKPTANIKRKSSTPIINWFQRKLAGTVRPRRVPGAGNGIVVPSTTQKPTSLKEFQTSRVRSRDVDENGYRAGLPMRRGMSNEISLNEDRIVGGDGLGDDCNDDLSTRKSSVAAASMWSRSNPREADDDASLRPLPPTSPPSPSPSRSSSSDPRTFRSMSASTKPTTVMSIDLTTGTTGMAHIAQAPPTPSTTGYAGPFASPHTTTTANPGLAAGPTNRFPPHIRTSSTGPGTSITFSALPPSPQSSSRPSSLNPARSGSLSGVHGTVIAGGPGGLAIQAPQHTSHHPRNNPRPSSPPLDNASMLTLASSAFATPGARSGGYQWAGGSGGDSVSHLGGGGDSMSHFVGDDTAQGEDRDASLRALRPRSSRRGSWDSEASGWSAAVSGMGSVGFPGRGERSVRTAPSFRTGGLTLDDQDGNASLLDGDGTSLRADREDDDIDEEHEKDEDNLPSHFHDADEPALETLDEREEVATPAMATKPLQSSSPELTPKKEEIFVLAAADELLA